MKDMQNAGSKNTTVQSRVTKDTRSEEKLQLENSDGFKLSVKIKKLQLNILQSVKMKAQNRLKFFKNKIKNKINKNYSLHFLKVYLIA